MRFQIRIWINRQLKFAMSPAYALKAKVDTLLCVLGGGGDVADLATMKAGYRRNKLRCMGNLIGPLNKFSIYVDVRWCKHEWNPKNDCLELEWKLLFLGQPEYGWVNFIESFAYVGRKFTSRRLRWGCPTIHKRGGPTTPSRDLHWISFKVCNSTREFPMNLSANSFLKVKNHSKKKTFQFVSLKPDC